LGVGPPGSAGGHPGAKPTDPALTGSGGRYLRIGEVADLLGVSTSTVYGLCAAGSLVHVRTTANSIRVRPVDLDAFVAARQAGGLAEAGGSERGLATCRGARARAGPREVPDHASVADRSRLVPLSVVGEDAVDEPHDELGRIKKGGRS
jgi:excisionase family DNA binding protein